MHKIKYTLLLCSIVITSTSFSQDLSKLREKQGYKEFKLGSDIRNYSDISKTTLKRLSDNDIQYVYNGSKYVNIGKNKINKIYFKTVDFRIYEILILIKNDIFVDENAVYYLLNNAFGEPNKKPLIKHRSSTSKEERIYAVWSIDNINLTYKYTHGTVMDTNVIEFTLLDLKRKALAIRLRNQDIDNRRIQKEVSKKALEEF